MTTNVYSGGIWKNITNFYVRNNNSWQEADTVYQKRSSNWEVIYDKGPYTWSGATIAALYFGYDSGYAVASATFSDTGQFIYSFSPAGFAYGPGGFGSELNNEYAPSSKVSSLEIRYDVTSVPETFSGSSVNTWLPLTTSRGWSLGSFGNYESVSGTILIRRNSLIVASGTLSLSASVTIFPPYEFVGLENVGPG